MTIAYPDFITAFPEFGNAAAYPQTQVAFWINQGYALLDPTRFNARLDLAVMLFAAHNMIIAARDVAAVTAGGQSGMTTGMLSSKSVGAVSASYDTASAAVGGAESYNQTSYGQRFFKLAKAASAGGVFVPAQQSWF